MEEKNIIVNAQTQAEIDANAARLKQVQDSIDIELSTSLSKVKENDIINSVGELTFDSSYNVNLSPVGIDEINSLVDDLSNIANVPNVNYDGKIVSDSLLNKQIDGMKSVAKNTHQQYISDYVSEYAKLSSSISDPKLLELELKKLRMYLDKKHVILNRNCSGPKIDNWYNAVSRKTFVHISDEIVFNTANQNGYDLVRVSSHSNPSDLCSPYEGKIFSLSGKSKDYTPYQDILFENDGGLRHKYCRHSVNIYIEGFSDEVLPPSRDKSEAQINKEAKQSHRKKMRDEYKSRYEKAKALNNDEMAKRYKLLYDRYNL